MNGHILVRPLNVSLGDNQILIPEAYQEFYFYGVVSAVAKDLSNKVIRKGRVGFFRKEAMMPLKGSGYLFKEEDMLLIRHGSEWHPLGWRLLLIRQTEEEIIKYGIILPAAYRSKDQTLFASVLSKGIIPAEDGSDKVIDYPVELGEILKIEKFDNKIIELDIEFGNKPSRCVIIKPSLLQYKEEKDGA